MVERRYGPSPVLDDIDYKTRFIKDHPQSVMSVTKAVNQKFGAFLPDETPIDQIVNITILQNREVPEVTLNNLWDELDLLPKQKEMITRSIAALMFSGCRTIKDIRNLAEKQRIRKMIGLGRIMDIWFFESFQKAEEEEV
jgi:hypothetical protein